MLANKLLPYAQGDGSRTLGERAFSILHEAIVRGVLEPGERLPIEDLAAVLEMSPMPIREAVRRLDSEGLAENIPHRGARVTELSLTDLREVYEARLVLEPIAVRRAALRFTPEDVEKCGAVLAEHQHAIESHAVEQVWATHTEFHLSLYRASASRWLMRLIMPLWQSSERYRRASGLDDWRLTERRIEHEFILRACTEHDPDRAAEALHDHLAISANVIATAMGVGELFGLIRAPTAS